MKPFVAFISIATLLASGTVAAKDVCTHLPKFPAEPTVRCPNQPCAPWTTATAIRQKLSGTALVSVVVNTTGQAQQVTLVTSSGHKELDKIAIRNARRFSYPLYRANPSGRAQCYQTTMPLEFLPPEG